LRTLNDNAAPMLHEQINESDDASDSK